MSSDGSPKRYRLDEQLAALSDEQLVELAATQTWRALALRWRCSDNALRKAYRRRGLLEKVQVLRAAAGEGAQEVAGADMGATGGTVTSPVITSWEAMPTPESLQEAFGIRPGDWNIDRQVVSTWGSLEAPCFQLKLWLSPKVIAEWPVTPAAAPAPMPRRLVKRAGDAQLVAILSDAHCPYFDPNLDRAVEQFLRDKRPHRIVINGDGPDLPTLSTHKRNPAFNASPQECVDSFGAWLARKRDAVGDDAIIQLLLGNHDQRLRDYMLKCAAEMYGLRPAGMPEQPPETLSEMMRRLLHLDALGIDIVAPPDDAEYNRAEVRLAKKLGVRHGKRTGKDALAKTAERLGYSIIGGHTHWKRTLFTTVWDEDGEPSVRVALDTGCLAQLDLGYTDEENPDHQQGFATAVVHQNGMFNAEHALWVNGSLLWRDERWTP